MPDPITSDSAFRVAMLALNGLAKRQEIIGRNLANIDTPGYQAQALNFESTLRQAMNEPDKVSLQVTNPGHLPATQQEGSFQIASRQGGSWRADGNNVDIDVELNQMAETGLRYQALTQLVSKKLLLLKAIANSR